MQEADRWEEGTVFIKSTDKEGRVTYTRHHCWSKTKFAVTMGIAALEAGGKAVQVTREEFDKAQGGPNGRDDRNHVGA